jgi:hypothetical protein
MTKPGEVATPKRTPSAIPALDFSLSFAEALGNL